jgi:hypothetical protein
MNPQRFVITVVLQSDVQIGDRSYLTPEIVKRQMELFLGRHQITDGLPCHGDCSFEVKEVVEEAR